MPIRRRVREMGSFIKINALLQPSKGVERQWRVSARAYNEKRNMRSVCSAMELDLKDFFGRISCGSVLQVQTIDEKIC